MLHPGSKGTPKGTNGKKRPLLPQGVRTMLWKLIFPISLKSSAPGTMDVLIHDTGQTILRWDSPSTNKARRKEMTRAPYGLRSFFRQSPLRAGISKWKCYLYTLCLQGQAQQPVPLAGENQREAILTRSKPSSQDTEWDRGEAHFFKIGDL